MTTGDLKNNLRKFHAELKRINYTSELDIEGFGAGRPSAFLPILHFVATEFSLELAQYFYSKDYELVGKNDKNFLSVLYKILRDEFNFKPPLTKEQFFTFGYAERKLQLVTSVIHLCLKKSEALILKKKKTAQGVKSAKTSKLNINHRIGRPVDKSNVRTKQSTGSTGTYSVSSVDTIPRYTRHFSKTGTCLSKQDTGKLSSDQHLINSPYNSQSEAQILPNELFMIESENGSFAVEQGEVQHQNVANIVRNMYTSSSALPRRSRLSPERISVDTSVGSKNEQIVKENICPKTGSYAGALITPLDQEHGAQNLVVNDKLDIPLLDRNSMVPGSKSSFLLQPGTEHPSSKKEMDMSLQEGYSIEARQHLSSKHISICQSKDLENPVLGQAIDMAGQDNNSQDFASMQNSVSHQSEGLGKPVLSQGIDVLLDEQLPSYDPSKHVFLPHRSKALGKCAVSGEGVDVPLASPNNYSQDHTSNYAFVPCESKNKVATPLSTNEDKLLLNKHSVDYAELLSVVRKQEERLNALEKDHAEKSIRFDNLVEMNSKLCARIVVLETTVALMQERLDSETE